MNCQAVSKPTKAWIRASGLLSYKSSLMRIQVGYIEEVPQVINQMISLLHGYKHTKTDKFDFFTYNDLLSHYDKPAVG